MERCYCPQCKDPQEWCDRKTPCSFCRNPMHPECGDTQDDKRICYNFKEGDERPKRRAASRIFERSFDTSSSSDSEPVPVAPPPKKKQRSSHSKKPTSGRSTQSGSKKPPPTKKKTSSTQKKRAPVHRKNVHQAKSLNTPRTNNNSSRNDSESPPADDGQDGWCAAGKDQCIIFNHPNLPT